MVKFSWDLEKNTSNKKKHGMSFEEAALALQNEILEIYHDPEHSDYEDRFVAITVSPYARLVLVVYVDNEDGTEIRIISARRPTKTEIKRIRKVFK